MRKRKVPRYVPPLDVADCLPVVEIAFREKISLGAAVEKVKATGAKRVPSRGTVLLKLPWASAVDEHALSHARILQGLAETGRAIGEAGK